MVKSGSSYCILTQSQSFFYSLGFVLLLELLFWISNLILSFSYLKTFGDNLLLSSKSSNL